ncbi:hypothetical protein FF011L_41820 [Roseimaritima multifibrata]|uniref:Uncharacterized protein n=1 Tax=Roseimaritima multifibrata TaxID=1930274 RepID=A0A517MKH2_9BACT|nr:hypothetical protein [Roseimaritima multifibrata]QDS95386.1 hypothetical protein FF011L_41820 [Roseimaritima multifibrata]
MLDRSEYVEQAYLFQLLRERIIEQIPLQELLEQVQMELLVTTRLPMAVNYLLTELKHSGLLSPAVERLQHYFTPFQAFLISEAEDETGRFDMRVALHVMQADAKFRSDAITPAGLFLFQFEALCRNGLNYDRGLKAVAADPQFDPAWQSWIGEVRNQVGFIDLADMIFLRSEEYLRLATQAGQDVRDKPVALFGEKEGRIAQANRRKDPTYLLSALQRHLNYPPVPRAIPVDTAKELLPQMMRRMERLEARLKLLEEEARGGIDLSKFYVPPTDFAGS